MHCNVYPMQLCGYYVTEFMCFALMEWMNELTAEVMHSSMACDMTL